MFYARVLCSRFRLKNWAVHLFSSFEIRALRFSNYTSHDRHNCRPKKYFPRNAHVEIQIKALLLSVEFFTSFSLRSSRQSTQGLPTMCSIAYFAVFGVSPSLQISIKFFIVNDSNQLRSAEVFRGSDVCPSLMFPSDTIALKSSWREFCGSDSRSFPTWPIIEPMLK